MTDTWSRLLETCVEEEFIGSGGVALKSEGGQGNGFERQELGHSGGVHGGVQSSWDVSGLITFFLGHSLHRVSQLA